MIVSFPFTFKFAYPGLPNPFLPNYAAPQSQPASSHPPPHEDPTAPTSLPCPSQEFCPIAYSPNQFAALPPASHISSNMPSMPRNLKRGWEPAFAEASPSTTTLATSNGYLNASTEYTNMTDVDESEHDDSEDLPASKRRRGLAGSIVSTAVNAALIGTAVGYTVYRLWRDRGKEPQPKALTSAISTNPESPSHYNQSHQLPPPPPYQEREWTPLSYPEHSTHEGAPLSHFPSPPSSRRRVARHSVRRSARKARVARAQAVFASPTRVDDGIQPAAAAAGPSSNSQPEVDFGQDGEEGEDDQMSWISDKLSQLIEEGKRALNREVVVMSDAQEDEVDDGSGVWEEEEDPTIAARTISPSRSNSLRRGTKRPRTRVFGVASANTSLTHISTPIPIPIPIPQHHHQHQQPPQNQQQHLTTPPTRKSHTKAYSVESALGHVLREDEAAWESPELRETMRLARERALAKRRFS